MKALFRLGTIAAVLLAAAPELTAQEEEPVESTIEYYWDANDGLRIRGDGFELRTGGRLVIDAVRYGHANERTSGLEVDDARLYITGGYDIFDFRIEPDLVGVDTPRNLYEAWAAVDLDPALRIAAGQMRVALGSEFATREEDLPLVGYGFTSYLDGRYDTALRADGALLGDSLWYEATATTGNGFGLEGRLRRNEQYSLRLVAHPLQWFGCEEGTAAGGLFVGFALARSPDGDEPIVLATPFESTVFRTPDLDGDAAKWRHLELGYRNGPFRAGWESVTGSADNVPVGGGQTKDMDQLTAWSLFASLNLTGEEQVWERGRWKWTSPSGEGRLRGWLALPGRLEAGARYSNADIDRNLFVYGLTGYDPSTQEVRTFSLDLNWYPDDRFAVTLGWVKTLADHELSTFGGTSRDSSFVLRVGVTF